MRQFISRGTAIAVILADLFFLVGDLVPKSVSIPVGVIVLFLAGGWLWWDVRRSRNRGGSDPADALVVLEKVKRAQKHQVREMSRRWLSHRSGSR